MWTSVIPLSSRTSLCATTSIRKPDWFGYGRPSMKVCRRSEDEVEPPDRTSGEASHRGLEQWKPSQPDPDALVFSTGKGTPLSRRNLLNRQFKPTRERLGLKGVTWHCLRHATATLSSSAGVPPGAVQELLGHSPSRITREVYLEAVPSDVKNAIQAVKDLFLGHQ